MWADDGGALTHLTSNTDTSSQLEALRLNLQGQLDPSEGLTEQPFRCKLASTGKRTPAMYYLYTFGSLRFPSISLGWPSTNSRLAACGPHLQEQNQLLHLRNLLCHLHACWEAAESCRMGDTHFRGHTRQWGRTQVPVHTPGLGAGCHCQYSPAPMLEHPPALDWLTATHR